MINSMMWFDNDPKTSLAAKVEKAADYYRHKYGREPNLCLIHPSMLGTVKEGDEAPKVIVRPWRAVLPAHLWIGVEEKS